MKVVFIIGNGFDINLGLATQYENFYRFYLGLDSSNDSIQVKKLKEHLKNDQDQEVDINIGLTLKLVWEIIRLTFLM